MKLFESSVFQFCILILFIAGLAAGFTDDLTWKDWLEAAMVLIGIYTTKEVGRYGASAYKDGFK
jgi:hypothetical protein